MASANASPATEAKGPIAPGSSIEPRLVRLVLYLDDVGYAAGATAPTQPTPLS